ncbi:MAG: hypothetical protein WC188_02310 [Candidatus Caldatribacteriota bacterium]
MKTYRITITTTLPNYITEKQIKDLCNFTEAGIIEDWNASECEITYSEIKMDQEGEN